jgi:hypothetical protein
MYLPSHWVSTQTEKKRKPVNKYTTVLNVADVADYYYSIM